MCAAACAPSESGDGSQTSGTSTSTGAQDSDAAAGTTASEDGLAGSGPAESSGQPPDGATDTTEQGSSSGPDAPSGELWVDEEGTVIGYRRVVVDPADGDSFEGLVELDADIAWEVSADRRDLFVPDSFGQAVYESSDCSGPVWVGPTDIHGFRPGVVGSALGVDGPIFFVLAEGAQGSNLEFASWYNGQYSCLNFETGIYPYPPDYFHPEQDLVRVTLPEFVAPLHIENH